MAHKASLAERRAELLARCAQQREEARVAVAGAMAPVAQLSQLRRRIGGFKVPLGVLGIVIGLALANRKRIVPTLTAAAGMWKLVQGLLDAFRASKASA